MKKFLLLIVLLTLVAGCATMNPNYQAYLAAAGKPLVQVDVDENGKIKSFIVGNPYLQQEKDHPAWRVAGQAIGALGMVGGIWVAGQSLGNIVSEVGKNSGHNMTMQNSGSWNIGTGSGQTGNITTSTETISGMMP